MLNYKFHLYPTKEQELALEQTLDGGLFEGWKWPEFKLPDLGAGLFTYRGGAGNSGHTIQFKIPRER